jgi:hypothetical protein
MLPWGANGTTIVWAGIMRGCGWAFEEMKIGFWGIIVG